MGEPSRARSRRLHARGIHRPLDREFHADGEVIGDILTRLLSNQTLHDKESRLLCKDVLAATETRYRQIVETAQEGIWVIDA